VKFGSVVRRISDRRTQDEAAGVAGQCFDIVAVRSDIADMGKRKGNQLASIGRISKNLLIAGHGGVEHQLADHRANGTDALASKNGPVGKHKCRRGFGSRRRMHDGPCPGLEDVTDNRRTIKSGRASNLRDITDAQKRRQAACRVSPGRDCCGITPARVGMKHSMSSNVMRDDLNVALYAAIERNDQRTISVMRLIQAALKERDEKAREAGRYDGLSDNELIAMMEAMAEHRCESMRRYEENGQLELAEREGQEIEVIQRFLPPKLDEESCSHAINQVIAELGASRLKDIGRVMTELKSRYPGQMNFAEARRRLCQQLS